MTWTERILEFPVRAAAVDTFLGELKARSTGDLNAVLTTLNESGLCREAVDHWIGRGWITPAPNSPLIALRGPAFARDLTLHDFCGDFEDSVEATAPSEEENEAHGDS